MPKLTLQNHFDTILIVGPIYDKIDKLDKIKEISKNYDLTILNGNICYPFEDAEKRIEYLETYLSSNVIYNVGNFDLQLLQQTNSKETQNWINTKPNVIKIEFKNKLCLIVTSGGISPKMKMADLDDSIETSFISQINEKPWHLTYGGGYGYVISNNPLTSSPPEFYNYSAQIGNFYSDTFKVYAQEADQYGLKDTILI